MRCKLLAVLALFAAAAVAQPIPAPQIQYVTADPTGVACSSTSIRLRTPNGTLYTCQSGVYAAAGGSSGGGGGVTYCAATSSGGSGVTWSSTPSPALSAYAAGTTLTFVPNVASGTTPTINVSGLGAKSITLADGSTAPIAGTFQSGGSYLLVYDGTVFRLAASGQPSIFGGSGATGFFRPLIECVTGSGSISSGTWTVNGSTTAALAGSSQDLVILTGLDGRLRISGAYLTEHTQFTGSGLTNVTLSMGSGTAGVAGSTDDVFIVQTTVGHSSGDQYIIFDRPGPNVIGSANTFSIVVGVRATGALVSALTGAFNYEVCGYRAQ